MKSVLLSILVFALCCVSCGGGSATGDGPVVIDIAARYPGEEIRIQDIAEVEYIPLEMAPDVLLSFSDRLFYLSDEYIMVQVRRTGDICAFDRSGRVVSRFNRQGRGPQEYPAIQDIVFDPAAREFFVSTTLPVPQILVYSLAGEWRRTLPLPRGVWATMWDMDPATLLVYDQGGLYDNTYSATPYSLISKADGSIIATLPITLPERYSTSTMFQVPAPDGSDRTFYSSMILSFANHRLGAGAGSGAGSDAGAGDFTLADYPSRDFNIPDNDTHGVTNTTATMLDPLRLTDALTAGELSGPLAEIAAGLREDDNPVVMIAKFK